jgi:hypothetical protein
MLVIFGHDTDVLAEQVLTLGSLFSYLAPYYQLTNL